MSKNNNRSEWAPLRHQEPQTMALTHNTYLFPHGVYIEHDNEDDWDPADDSILELWLKNNIGFQMFDCEKETYFNQQSKRYCEDQIDGTVYLFQTIQDALKFYERFAFYDYHFRLPVGQISFVEQNALYPHSVLMNQTPDPTDDGKWPELHQMERWLTDNCYGEFQITAYKLDYQTITIFVDPLDAMAFKIMFGEWC